MRGAFKICCDTYHLFKFYHSLILKVLSTCLILLCFQNLSKSQTIIPVEIFSNTHGIKQEGMTFYEVEGYSIFTENFNSTFDEKGLKKIKKKYSIKKEVPFTTDSTFPSAKIFVITDTFTTKVTGSTIYYLFPKGQTETKIIGVQTVLTRDKNLEAFFVKSILDNTIPESIYTPTGIDSIRFSGRYISLGPACRWMGPHNIQCPNLGQMNWAEFRNIIRAKELLEAQFEITANKSIGEIVKQDTINITFEGSDTKAVKAKYKIKVPQLIMGGSNILIIYYVTATVRGKYVSCVLSHYTDDVNANKLPPLLSEVMKLKE